MKKKGIALLLTGLMIAATPFSVYADREDAKLNVPYVSLGADLNTTEHAAVFSFSGSDRGGTEGVYCGDSDK